MKIEEYREIISFIRRLYDNPDGIIPLHAPVFVGNEKKYLEECINSTYVSSVGKYVDLFENAIAKYTGSKKAVACVNGTSALHLALKLSGVKKGDEVITQPLTFVATANAITYCGAEPVFLDVDLDTMGLSPAALKKWLEKNVILKPTKRKTKNARPESKEMPINKRTNCPVSACIPMHTFGHPCRIDEIIGICNKYNIPVVEDAAESLGSSYKGQHTGTFGKIGVLSFNGNKILTTGGGGMLLFSDEDLAKRCKHLSTQAKIQHPWEFSHDETGYNYRMPNINAALGLAQIEHLSAFVQSKRNIAKAYRDFFSISQFSTIKFITEPPNAFSNYWLNCILLSDRNEREDFLKYFVENGIISRPAWNLMNHLPMFYKCQTDDLKTAKYFVDRLVNLPSSVLENRKN